MKWDNIKKTLVPGMFVAFGAAIPMLVLTALQGRMAADAVDAEQ